MKDKAKGFLLGAFSVTLLAAGAVALIVKGLSDSFESALFQGMFGLQDDPDSETADGTFVAVIAEGRAYWIGNNTLMVAPVDADEEIDFDSAIEYNAMEAPRSELSKIMLILDSLKEDS